MPSFFSEYLSPTNPIALVIVICLICSFIAWLVGLIIYWIILSIKKRQIENNQDIQPLVTARQERDSGRDDNEAETDANPVFQGFCAERSLSENSFILKHLKAIFLAGWNESRLEVSELINHTASNLFRWNSLLRSVLAIFIVIGLLGTLFGLTDSLVKLAPALRASAETQTPTENGETSTSADANNENSRQMTKALSDLMDDIKGAFAPSIVGVFFTVLGVILYGIFLRFACHPVKSTLEQSTLTLWVPQLYPTTSQKLIQTLRESEAQMRSGYETAVRVDGLVENIQTNVDGFNKSLTQANAITEPLAESGTKINAAASAISTAADELNKGFTKSLNDFADVLNRGFLQSLREFSAEFTSNVTHLTGFQDEIRNLHGQFQEAANQKLDQQTEKLDQQNQNLVQALKTLEQVLRSLKDYETTYINSWKQIDETLQTFIRKVTETNTSIYEENREWFESINDANKHQFIEMQSQLKTEIGDIQQTFKNQLDSLTAGLAVRLENVQHGLDSGLTSLNERLENFDTPLKETVEELKGDFNERLTTLNERLEKFNEPLQASANQMRDTYADSVRYMQGIFSDLQQEINKQNEKYEEQLTGVRNLNERVEGLLTQLGENSKNQKNAVDQIKETFDNRLEILNERLEKFNEPLQASANQMRGTYADSVAYMQGIFGALKQEVIEQNEKYEEQLTGVGNLNKGVLNLLNQLEESSRNQSIAVSTLNSKVGNLTENTQALADAITCFTSDSGAISHSIATIERHAGTLGTASQQFVEKVEKADVTPLNENIEELNKIIGSISQSSQTLADAVNQLAEQIDLSRMSESERNRKKRSFFTFFSKLNPFSRRKTDGRQ